MKLLLTNWPMRRHTWDVKEFGLNLPFISFCVYFNIFKKILCFKVRINDVINFEVLMVKNNFKKLTYHLKKMSHYSTTSFFRMIVLKQESLYKTERKLLLFLLFFVNKFCLYNREKIDINLMQINPMTRQRLAGHI